MLTWELIGAVVGAGLASGREIASFFSQYGVWSWGGIFIAVMVLGAFADTHMPASWQQRWQDIAWKWLLKLLLMATGSAMLSGAGEIGALTIPWNCAYWIGMGGTLLASWYIANRIYRGLAWVSRILLGLLAMLLLIGLTLPPMRAVHIKKAAVVEAIVRSAAYGGFNAALQVPLMENAALPSRRDRRLAVRRACVMLLMLLMLGNALLLRHPALIGETLPFVQLLSHCGKAGYALGLLCLYLAILSTLTACLRGLNNHPASMLIIAGGALLGFSGVITFLYPLLGGGCLVMLIAAKFTNYVRASFISKQNVL